MEPETKTSPIHKDDFASAAWATDPHRAARGLASVLEAIQPPMEAIRPPIEDLGRCVREVAALLRTPERWEEDSDTLWARMAVLVGEQQTVPREGRGEAQSDIAWAAEWAAWIMMRSAKREPGMMRWAALCAIHAASARPDLPLGEIFQRGCNGAA